MSSTEQSKFVPSNFRFSTFTCVCVLYTQEFCGGGEVYLKASSYQNHRSRNIQFGQLIYGKIERPWQLCCNTCINGLAVMTGIMSGTVAHEIKQLHKLNLTTNAFILTHCEMPQGF